MEENKKKIILIVLALISIVAITIGITYAFFNYAGTGTTDNTITSGSIEFLYTENPIAGRGIALTDALPMSDSDGIRLSGEGNEFNFTITSKTASKIAIPYEITARRELEVNTSDNLDPSVVRIYLAKVETGLEDQQVLLANFDKLATPKKTGLDTTIERLLYSSKVPSGEPNYEQHFKLKMWIDNKTEFSPIVDGDNITYPYNNKKFTIKVNVYANGKALTDEDLLNENKAEIESIKVNNTKAVKVDNRSYDYELGLATGTKEVDLSVLTLDSDADVKIEKVNNNTSMNNIQRLSLTDKLSVVEGDNLFKITTTSIKDKNVRSENTINIHVGEYQDSELNGTDPVVRNNLIPIIIENDGSVYKVDTNYKWYDYNNKEWANAVILKDKSVNYNTGDKIPEENIESYFVWIPKYSYELWNVGTTNPTKTKHQIPIRFGTENTTSVNGVSCITPISNDQGIAGSSSDCNNGEYMTHPAFITLGVNGFWVGKFETGYDGASTKEAAQINSNESSKIIIKPDVYSWRNINVKNAFETSYNYIKIGETNYSHMMKNTEWGAVAYLSHSKYGIGTEVRINNNPNFKTGYVASVDSNQSTNPGDYTKYELYNTEQGYKASTTGNITGIYDVSGGTWEYMASYMTTTDANLSNSGFTNAIINTYPKKYFDIYPSNSTNTSYTNRILGDATGEMGSFTNLDNAWYSDFSLFIATSNLLWFHRGGCYGDGVRSGQFTFNNNTGAPIDFIGFRIVVE